MRVLAGPLSAWLLLATGQGCGGSEDRCAGVACDQPPASACLDADRLRTFASPGQCQADTGQCSYAPTEQTCEFGCGQGGCLAQDLCLGVVCDEPPQNTCLDAITVRCLQTRDGNMPDPHNPETDLVAIVARAY